MELKTFHRTHSCGELNKKSAGKDVTLCGWVDSIRIQGKIAFINIRDRYGITQLVIKGSAREGLESLHKESVIKVKGVVNARPDKLVNKEMSTGDVEVDVKDLEVVSSVDVLPLQFAEDINTTEETRLKYRYLDLRRPELQNGIIMRSKIVFAFREFMQKNGFIEVETPVLGKSTPEGARDYLVPSRVHKGKFYALPQSPQLFKQLLMVAGFDRYFQVAKCFRDEDLRADRQPEFTQLDAEMSFVDEEDIYSVVERSIQYVLKEVFDIAIKIPFQRISYDEAMKKYKSDKPDMRKKDEKFAFVWVVDFPMFEYSKEEKKYVAAHHPFCMPRELDKLEKDPLKVKAKTYDLVLNGTELLSGSIRIHDPEIQKRVFKVLGIKDKEAEEKFGFMLNAFKYGAPIHGGFAIGLDRLIQILLGTPSIREVIAFPKNKDGKDLMLDAPADVDKSQLDILGIKTK